jgi:hypothetical protein
MTSEPLLELRSIKIISNFVASLQHSKYYAPMIIDSTILDPKGSIMKKIDK